MTPKKIMARKPQNTGVTGGTVFLGEVLEALHFGIGVAVGDPAQQGQGMPMASTELVSLASSGTTAR